MSEMAANNVISATGLTKRYGRTVALDGLDLEVARGLGGQHADDGHARGREREDAAAEIGHAPADG